MKLAINSFGLPFLPNSSPDLSLPSSYCQKSGKLKSKLRNQPDRWREPHSLASGNAAIHEAEVNHQIPIPKSLPPGCHAVANPRALLDPQETWRCSCSIFNITEVEHGELPVDPYFLTINGSFTLRIYSLSIICS